MGQTLVPKQSLVLSGVKNKRLYGPGRFSAVLLLHCYLKILNENNVEMLFFNFF